MQGAGPTCVCAKRGYLFRSHCSNFDKQAGVAQLVEQLICNQQVGGSNPSTSSNNVLPYQFVTVDSRVALAQNTRLDFWEGFPSGQRGQTVNLLVLPSEVRILPPPPKSRARNEKAGTKEAVSGRGTTRSSYCRQAADFVIRTRGRFGLPRDVLLEPCCLTMRV